MPKIDGYELRYAIMDPDNVLQYAVDTLEIGEFSCSVAFVAEIRSQEQILGEYRFRLGVRRRTLARQALPELVNEVEKTLKRVGNAYRRTKPNRAIINRGWGSLRTAVKSIEALLGSSVRYPERWDMLMRHLDFGEHQDYEDIVNLDWPSVKAGLEKALCGDIDPIPVNVADLGDLVSSKPSGPIATKLNWGNLTDSGFERLVFNLIDRTEGYEKPEWLTHTNAPDGGRDLSVFRVQKDALVDPRRLRVILACKHTKSVGLAEVSKLKAQMALWTQPRVDELIIVTTGRFSKDAIQWVESHNQSEGALHIEMWPESHLERLLAQRPELIAEFRLR
jgi:hypothetical protein